MRCLRVIADDTHLATRARNRAASAQPATGRGDGPVTVPASWKNEARSDAAPVQIKLRRDVDAPGLARGAVSSMLADLELSGSTAHTLILLVSEVVSNAVLHSTGPDDAPIGFAAGVVDDVVRVT